MRQHSKGTAPIPEHRRRALAPLAPTAGSVCSPPAALRARPVRDSEANEWRGRSRAEPLATGAVEAHVGSAPHNAPPATHGDRHGTPCGEPWRPSRYSSATARRAAGRRYALRRSRSTRSPARQDHRPTWPEYRSRASEKGAVGGCTMSPTTNPTIAPIAPSAAAPTPAHRKGSGEGCAPVPLCELPAAGWRSGAFMTASGSFRAIPLSTASRL